MKHLILALLLTCASCAAPSRESLSLSQRQEFDSLLEAEQAAAETPEPEDDELVAERWAEFEARVAKERAAPLAGLLPYGLGGIALELVGLASSKRKRKLYGSALKNLSRGQVATAAGDALKAWGQQHSSPQPPSQS